MQKFGVYLKSLIDDRTSEGMSEARLAEALGVDKSYISQIEKGQAKPPTQERCAQIAEALRLSKTERAELMRLAMIERAPDELRGVLEKALGRGAEILELTENPELYVKVPQFAYCPASPKHWTTDEVESYHFLPKELVKGRRFYLIRVKGDSMNRAGIESGDLVLVDADELPENGRIVVICIDQEFTMKRFYRNGDKVTLVPDSTNSVHAITEYDARRFEIHARGVVKKIYMKEPR